MAPRCHFEGPGANLALLKTPNLCSVGPCSLKLISPGLLYLRLCITEVPNVVSVLVCVSNEYLSVW